MPIIERIKAAYQAVKSIPFPTGTAQGGAAYQPSIQHYFYNTGTTSDPVDYAAEVGDLRNSSLMMAPCRWLATNLPEAPIHVLQRKTPKVFEPLPDHPMAALLSKPNPFYSGRLLWGAFAYSWLTDGNGYFLKFRNGIGDVIQLWYEPHFSIRGRWPGDPWGEPITPENVNEFITRYEVLRNGKWISVAREDVIHIQNGIDPDNPRRGINPVQCLLGEIFTDQERMQYSAMTLKNGGVIPYVLTVDPSASNVEINTQEIKEEWVSQSSGKNLGRPMVLTGPMKVQTIGASPEKLLVNKASQIPEERVAAVLGIPAAVLGFGVGLEQTKVGATMRELREQAYESFIIPLQSLIADELNAQLLPDFGNPTGLKCQHDLSQVRVLQADRDDLFKRETLAYEKGVKTRAEARSSLGLDTKPEDEVYYVQAAEEQKAIEPAPQPLALPVGDVPPQLLNGKDQSKEVVN